MNSIQTNKPPVDSGIIGGHHSKPKQRRSILFPLLCTFTLFYTIAMIRTFLEMSDFILSSETMDRGNDDDGIILEKEEEVIVQKDLHLGSTTHTIERSKKSQNRGEENNSTYESVGSIVHRHRDVKSTHTSSVPTEQRSLQFLHIPKNAGSTITDSAKEANIAWGYCRFQMNPTCPDLPVPRIIRDDINKEDAKYLNYMLSQVHILKLDDTNQYLWHYPPSIVMDILRQHQSEVSLERIVNPYLNSDLFVVVRNPYDRIISAYYHWETMHHDIEKVNSEGLMNRLIGESLDEFERDYHLYRGGHYIPQYDFVYDSISDSYSDQNHSQKQTKKKEKIVQHVIQFDNFAQEFQQLMKQYNINITLQDHRTVKRRRNKKATLTKYNISEVNLKRIEYIYLNDFKEFGFPFLNGTVF